MLVWRQRGTIGIPDNREPYGTKGSFLWDTGIWILMGQRDPTYWTKGILKGQRDPYGTKGSYLWDKGILKGQRDPYGTKGALWDI